MDWIALAVFAVAMLVGIGTLSHFFAYRRRDRLETAFYRARGQRLTANGSRF